MNLYIDDYLIEKGFNSTEEYLNYCLNNNAFPKLKGSRYFTDLFNNNILEEGMMIRTYYNRGGADGHYYITKKGTLKGIEHPVYSGKQGEFNPEEILSIKKSPDGWSIESTSALGYLLRKRENK